MLKNRHIEVKLVKDNPSTPNEDVIPVVNPEEISRLAKDLVKFAAVAGVIVAGAAVVLNTLSQIAVISAEANIKKDND